jgi:hypothetical protein
MPNFDATADLYRLEMRTPIYGHKSHAGPRWLESGRACDLMRKVVAKREADQPVYSITVPLEAGFGKGVLNFRDIREIAKHSDFPT